MAFNWRKFPWTNLHDLNLDWIIQKVKTLEDNLADAMSRVKTAVDEAISNTLTGSGDLTINKTGDVRISGNSVQLSKTVISDRSEQLTLHNPNSNTNMTANYNNGVLTLSNNQQLANGVAVYPINTPADGGGDNSDFAANVGYVKDAVAAVDGKLDTEISNRTSGDAALQSTIDNVIMPRLDSLSAGAGAVRYDITQTLSDTEKAKARSNIGAGTSNFDGNYSSLTGKPTIPTKTSDLINDSGFGVPGTLTAGAGITIVEDEDGKTIIASDVSYGNGLVSFVDKGGVPIAQFTLNQTQDCEINVNDLTAHLHNKFVELETSDTRLQTSLSNNYRTAAAQDAIDNTKLTDAPKDGKTYARKNGMWSEFVVNIDSGVESVNGKTGVVTLNATEIPSTKFVPKDTISFLIDGAFDEELVELRRNGASASATDFISAINSGAPVTVGLHDQGNPKVTFDDRPVKYKITGDTLSLCFIAEAGHTYTPAIYVLSGTTSGIGVTTLVEHNFTDSFYQENYVSANDLPVQAPLSVEEYLEALEARIAALESK